MEDGKEKFLNNFFSIFYSPFSIFLFCFFLFFCPLGFSKSDLPKLPVGEKLVYEVRYLGLQVGEGTAEVKEIVEIRSRKAYHIQVEVRSARILDWIYKVRDTHHSYMDVEKLHSLRYEKILHEGRYRADEVMDYDQEKHTAVYFSRKNKSQKEMEIPPHVQDQLSCGYWARLQKFEPGSEFSIPVNADEKNWYLKVKVLKKTNLGLKKFGKLEAMEVEPIIRFQGLFVKRGKIRGWIGTDSDQTPLKMTVKVPVLGSVTAHLVEKTLKPNPSK